MIDMRSTAAVLLMLLLTWPASAEQPGRFLLTLDEVAQLIDKGDQDSLATAHRLVEALRQNVAEADRPRVEAYAARLLLAQGKYEEGLMLVEPYIEQRERLDRALLDCYFTAGLIRQAMAFRESPASNKEARVTFMGLEVAVNRPAADELPLVGEGLAHATEALELFSFIASNAPTPARIDALDQAGRTLIIMHQWDQAAHAYRLAIDQTRKADPDVLDEEHKARRVAAYEARLASIAGITKP